MKLLFLFILLLCSSISIAQNTNNIWYFGDGNFLDFNANMQTPVLSANGVEMATPVSTYCQEGSSTICDASGNLLFYNNSENVWDKNYNPMPNGSGLIGSASTSAQTMIVPKPGSSDIYYIFHMGYAAASPNNGLYYSEVDMSLNGGLGAVTANKNISLGGGACSEQLKAVTHCNGIDIWVISHSATGNTFNCNLITATGVSATSVATSIGNNHPTAFSGMSYMTCSKDGSKIAIAGDMGGTPSVEVFSFDNLNGTLCNPQYLTTPDFAGSYGVEFSADGTKLYTTAFQLHQYDFLTAQWFTYAPIEIGSALMRGPNDKIYLVAGCDYYDSQAGIMYYSRDIHVVETPNIAGAGANLQMNAYLTPRECGLGLPTCYYPTQSSNTCAPMNASFTADNLTVCEGDCVNFTNVSTGASIDTYQWTFAGGTPSTFIGSTPPTVCYSTQGIHMASLQITDCSGGISTFQMDINVLDCTQPLANLQADQTQFCVNNCVNYSDLSTGTNINSWLWSFPGATPNTSTDQNPMNICYNVAGSYDVTLTINDDLGTNTITIPAYIQVEPCIAPDSDFSAPDTICAGDCIDFLDASLNLPTQWNWTLNGSVQGTSTDQNPQGICFNTAGVFSIELTVTNAYGMDSYSEDIVVLTTPDAGSDIAVSFCETDLPQNLELLLNPNVPLNGTWINVQNTAAFAGTFFSPNMDVPGVYEIQYVLMNLNCSDTLEFIIEVENNPDAGIDGTLGICDNDLPVDLMGVLQGTPDLNGVWSPVLSSGNSTLDPSVDPQGIYTYIVPQTISCLADTSKATVEITYVSDVSITPIENLCNTSDEITLESNIANGQWTGVGISNGDNGTFDPVIAGAGVHTIIYSIEIDDCQAETETDIVIEEPPQVDLGGDLANCSSSSLTLEVDANPNDVVTWSNGTIDNSSATFNFEEYNLEEIVTVEVQIENSCGISSDLINIELIDCEAYVYIPNSFTPDGDEYNNTFLPILTGENITDYEILIFNRWGEVVFQSRDINQGWDGTYNGKLVENGIYSWSLVYTNSINAKSDKEKLWGHVSVIF